MLSTTIDKTADFNLNNNIKIDCGQWQNCTIHVSGNVSGTINVLGTNDSGAIIGVTDGNDISSVNYTAIQGINLATGASVTSIASAGNYKFVVGTRFIQVGGLSAAITGKLILLLNTPT